MFTKAQWLNDFRLDIEIEFNNIELINIHEHIKNKKYFESVHLSPQEGLNNCNGLLSIWTYTMEFIQKIRMEGDLWSITVQIVWYVFIPDE
jgi:hypothetical protein